jgi:hypothetical protein
MQLSQVPCARREFGAPEPKMPFDESKFGPMPEVEIDSDDEFHVGNVSES